MVMIRDKPSQIREDEGLPVTSHGVLVHRVRDDDHMEGIEYPVDDQSLSVESHWGRTTRLRSEEGQR